MRPVDRNGDDLQHTDAAARSLGVERSHLWRVVSGERHSRRLLQAFKAWMRDNEATVHGYTRR